MSHSCSYGLLEAVRLAERHDCEAGVIAARSGLPVRPLDAPHQSH